MKKITAFFMALLPLVMVTLLFAAGLIVKNVHHVYVQSVELSSNELTIQKPDETHDKEFTLDAKVIPTNATNPEIIWDVEDKNVATVNNEGLVSCKNYGETYIFAKSKENPTILASCKLEVNDTQIHSIEIKEAAKYDVAYMGINERKQIKPTLIPATGIIDTTLNYEVADEESKKYIDVAPDGTILPKQESNGAKAKIKVSPKTGSYASRKTVIETQIGPGVQQVVLKDQTESITSSNKYNFFNQLYTYPETNVSATDFVYESDNTDIATIDANGIATFKQEGTAQFKATYKRDNTLSASKSVYSTCNFIKDVRFNSDDYIYNIDYDIQNKKYVEKTIESDTLTCDVFPLSASKDSSFIVTSSDNNVVEPIKGNNGTYTFKAKRPGVVTLLAQAFTGESLTDVVSDGCQVTITCKNDGKDLGIVKSSELVLEEGQFYYPLIKSLNIQEDFRTAYPISYEVDDTDIAYADDNGILHFTKPGAVNVSVYVDNESSPSGTIKVTCIDKTTTIDANDKIVINVGQKYNINNGSAVFKHLLIPKSYAKNFDYTDNYFIPKNGCNITDFEVLMNDGSTKYINLIVKEDPLYITNTIAPYLVTEQVEYNFKKDSGSAIVPSTATKEDGSNYELKYEYQFSNDKIIVEDDDIKFADQGMAEIITSFDKKHTITNYVKSTYGNMGKFIIKDVGGNRVKSNQTITYSGSSIVLSVYDLTKSQANQIEADVISKTELCDIKKEVISETLFGTIKEVRFTIIPKAELYGIETIAIRTKANTYATFINIEIPATMTDVKLTYGREVLSSDKEIFSYTENLTLNIMPYPALPKLIEKDAYTVKLGEEALPVVNNTVTINNLSGTKILSIYPKGSTTAIKQFTLIKKDYSQLEISVIGADDKNNIYLGANERQKTMYLKANGLVPLDFFMSDNFKVSLTGQLGEKASVMQDVLTISDLPAPDGSEYKTTMTLKYNDTELGQFPITRDIVSKIKLPNHDNDDMTDKKGMQKVHVYGHMSYFDDAERAIDGYRMPIKVYDYKGQEVFNDPKSPDQHQKTKLINTLNLNISNGSTVTYDESRDCLFIKFADNNIYRLEEIVNNEFDAKNNKNIILNVSTKSNMNKAKYEFVVVNGVNIYNLYGLAGIVSGKIIDFRTKKINQTAVLQINFGLDAGAKENVPLNSPIGNLLGIYGNGYTINSDWSFTHPESYWYHNSFSINVKLKGCNDSTYQKIKHDIKLALNIDDQYLNETCYFVYSEYKNFGSGIVAPNDKPYKIKNSIFYTNKCNSLDIDKSTTTCHIKESVFIDSKPVPILVRRGASVYFKGYIGIYSFATKEDFNNVMGIDLSSAWPLIESACRKKSMVDIGADGRTYVNSFMATLLTDNIYFWNNTTQQYEKGTKGTPDAANFIAKYIDIGIPLTQLQIGLWATYNKSYDPASFSYYDEYDEDGNIRPDFLQKQIDKLTRKPIYF